MAWKVYIKDIVVFDKIMEKCFFGAQEMMQNKKR